MFYISKIVNVQPYFFICHLNSSTKRNPQRMYKYFFMYFIMKIWILNWNFCLPMMSLFHVSNEVAMVRRKKDLSLTKFVLLSTLCSSMHSCSCFLWNDFPFLFLPSFLLIFLFYQTGETKCVFCTNGKMKIENGLGDYWPL